MKNAIRYAMSGANTILYKFKPSELPPTNRFHYHQGVFLSGVMQVWKMLGYEKYFDYVKEWVDFHIDSEGEASKCHIDEFDDIQPGILLFDIMRTTGDNHYKRQLDRSMEALKSWPLNSKGGVWHKHNTPNEMWLDTMYMIGPAAARYAKEYNEPELIEFMYKQAMLMRKLMTKSNGLMFHGYDDERRMPWADKESGCSPEVWGRAQGWYCVGVLDILEYVPKDSEIYKNLSAVITDLINALVKYQDVTGRWFQIVDRPDDPENWLETSCSALFTYTIAKAIRMGIVDTSYFEYAIAGYQGTLRAVVLDQDGFKLTNVCVGTGVGCDKEYYYNRNRVINDLHGMGAFILMCSECDLLYDYMMYEKSL